MRMLAKERLRSVAQKYRKKITKHNCKFLDGFYHELINNVMGNYIGMLMTEKHIWNSKIKKKHEHGE